MQRLSRLAHSIVAVFFISKGNSVLHWAAKRGHSAVLRILVAQLKTVMQPQASIPLVSHNATLSSSSWLDTPNKRGHTPCMLACLAGHADCVKVLMQNGTFTLDLIT